MKYRHLNLVICLAFAMAFLTTGCPQPKSRTITGSCTVNNQGVRSCTVGGSIVYRPGDTTSADEGSELIIDVPDGWALKSGSESLEFHANSDSSQPQITAIPLTLTTLTRDPIGTQSSTKVFAGDDTAIDTALSSKNENYESKFVSQFGFEQADCNLPSGIYTFHVRYQSSPEARAAYIAGVEVNYTAGSNPSCSGGTVTIQ